MNHEPTEPRPAASLAAEEAAFVRELEAANQRCRNWREKLDWVRASLTRESPAVTPEQLVDVAIYLRFLGTGQVACAEDGRHYRPSHHARIAQQIRERLAQLTTPATAYIARKLYPWLPSSAAPFQRAEPLTRIRDIAHRNDIPSDLKHEIKHTLQNKLHRCAGPEDLVTSSKLLERITAPDAHYSPDFVEQFKIFHGELREFFNARSLEERLHTLLPHAGPEAAAAIQSFLSQKNGSSLPPQLRTLTTLTELRDHCLRAVASPSRPETQDFLLADIALEDFAFVLLSEMLNALDRPDAAPDWPVLLQTLGLTLRNLAQSGLEPEECAALQSELHAWSQDFKPSDRDQLLRLKATAERSLRLAQGYSERILALFPPRVEQLGRALGVPEHAIRVFCEAEIRGHLIFQFSKLASCLLRHLRHHLALPPWDVIVSGRVTGRLRAVGTLDELPQELCSNGRESAPFSRKREQSRLASAAPEPLVLALCQAEGDEEIPKGVAGIVLAHDLPHLSHLGVRARQAGVVLVACEEPANFSQLQGLEGQTIYLAATPDKVDWGQADAPVSTGPSRLKVELSLAHPVPKHVCLALEELAPGAGGGKAEGARKLAELAGAGNAGFSTPASLVVPLGVMEAALRAAPELAAEYNSLSRDIHQSAPPEFGRATARLQALIQQLPVPEEIVAAVRRSFDENARLMVRSSANCEDLPELAAAGLYESVANVAPADVAAAVRSVWASLWSQAAALSRQQAGIPHEQARMAVLIQAMLTPDYSFVLHTVNPLTRNPDEVYAEVAVGLGEALVSGTLRGSPYRLVCHKHSGASRTLAFANFSQALRPDSQPTEMRPGRDGLLVRQTLDYSRIELSLDAGARAQLGARLAAIAGRVEEAFQRPQDIEGVVVGDNLSLVQARPQQGLAPEPG